MSEGAAVPKVIEPVRRAGAVTYVYPRLTLPVRSTGSRCSLNCAHCGGHYLEGMHSLDEVLEKPAGEARSYLVSGASDRRGAVPHHHRLGELASLARRGALNLHPGLVDQRGARELGAIASAVSFDFTVDASVIGAVYGLPLAPADYIESYRLLRRYCRRVVPHICIGLLEGRIRGEYAALEALRREGAAAISFLVFRPTPGTAMARCAPPPVEDVGSFLAEARAAFPDTPLYLGCMRPGGRYRDRLDVLALKAGMNKIVHPAPAARYGAASLGMETILEEECCAL